MDPRIAFPFPTIECHDNVLSIKGEKRDEREESDEHRHYVERSYGQFTRSFRMVRWMIGTSRRPITASP